jgi:LPS-assembly protein
VNRAKNLRPHLLALLLAAFSSPFLCPGTATAAETEAEQSAPVDLSADSIVHDNDSKIIRAVGHVELIQGERILRANIVSYNLKTDTVTASGNVVLTEPNGDVHFADSVTLSTQMQSGFVSGLNTMLAGGGNLVAESAERADNKVITMYNASYTPCDCEKDEDGDAAWQISADEVVYDENKHKISYKNAQFEVFGVPVFYTPRLSHPDNKVKRKSGFLMPTLGFNSDLGAHIAQGYYYDLAQDKDLTVGALHSTNDTPVAIGEYRQRFAEAQIKLAGSITNSERTDDIDGVGIEKGKETRGHVLADGLWNMSDKWRSGFSVEYASDDQYLRQYNFSSKDVLENEIYAERFSDRNYAAGRILAFQDVRIRELQSDQPNVLPEMEISMMGDPNGVLGGRWELDTSMLGLSRSDGQDMERFSMRGGWNRRLVTDFGLVNTLDLSARGDAYRVADRDIAVAGSGRSNEGSASRFFPEAHFVTSYPFAKPYEKMQATIEPVASITGAPNLEDQDSDIPNEDSQDVQIDASNLFEPNRFPGTDRIEDRSHATYGLRTGFYGYEGSFLTLFGGQSYRFSDSNNPFPSGSGLNEQESDYVGQIAAQYADMLGIDYRFQLASDSLTSQRHEFDGYGDFGRVHLDSRYLFAKALEGTDIEESREQVRGGIAYDLTQSWRARTDVLYDLGESEGLREAGFGFDYMGCCMSLSTTFRRNVTLDASGESGTEVMVRIGLKGLGEFGPDDGGIWRAGNR